MASWLYAYPMLSRGATKCFIGKEIVFTISFIVLTYGLVKIHGVVGVNMAYAITYIVYFMVVFKGVKRFEDYEYF